MFGRGSLTRDEFENLDICSNLAWARLSRGNPWLQADGGRILDGVAAGTPAASAVEALVSSLPAETTLATALDELSAASGGAINPEAALRQVIQDEGQPGGSGANGGSGGSGAAGASGAPGASGSAAGSVPSKTPFSLRPASGSLKGHPGSRVRVRFSVSSAAKLSYSGRKLAGGARKVGSGSNVLMVKMPSKHGNYQLMLKAVSTTDGESAQATVSLHDSQAKAARKAHR